MATPVLMPLMGMTMEEGIISTWLVAEGDTVKEGDPILEFETDKINATIDAPADGIIGGISAAPGVSVKVQGIVCYLLEPGEELPAGDPEPPAVVAPAPVSPAAPPAPHLVMVLPLNWPKLTSGSPSSRVWPWTRNWKSPAS